MPRPTAQIDGKLIDTCKFSIRRIAPNICLFTCNVFLSLSCGRRFGRRHCQVPRPFFFSAMGRTKKQQAAPVYRAISKQMHAHVLKAIACESEDIQHLLNHKILFTRLCCTRLVSCVTQSCLNDGPEAAIQIDRPGWVKLPQHAFQTIGFEATKCTCRQARPMNTSRKQAAGHMNWRVRRCIVSVSFFFRLP